MDGTDSRARGGGDETRPGAGVWDPTHRRLTIGLLLVISITAFEALAVATVLPATAENLGGAAAIGWYGWVFSGFMLANLVGVPAAGILADRGGPARPFTVGCLLFALGLLVAGFASSMPVVVAGRIAQGLGAGALSSVAYVAVARGYAARHQPRMLALLASAWVIPGILGPSAAAGLALQFGWRSVFLLLVPMTAMSAWLAMKGLRDLEATSKGEGAAAGQMRNGLRLALGAGIALLGAETRALAPTLLCVVVGTAIGLPALRRLLPPGTLTAAPGAPAALAAKGLVTFAFFGAEAFLPLALTTIRGESMAMSGLALSAGTLAWTAGTWFQERLVTRFPRVLFVRGGLALVALAVVGAAAVLVAPAPGLVAIASWAVAGFGIGISYPTTTLIVFERTPEGGEGSAASALQLVNVLGVAFGAGAGGAILALATARGGSQTAAIATIDAVMMVAALIGIWATNRRDDVRSGIGDGGRIDS
ncbi:MAG: MFS transporter [Candidatus Binatia bacterium]